MSRSQCVCTFSLSPADENVWPPSSSSSYNNNNNNNVVSFTQIAMVTEGHRTINTQKLFFPAETCVTCTPGAVGSGSRGEKHHFVISIPTICKASPPSSLMAPVVVPSPLCSLPELLGRRSRQGPPGASGRSTRGALLSVSSMLRRGLR